MSFAPDARDDPVPLFSVIIPLAFHRNQWELCLQQWRAQSLADAQYELVLVTPSDFAERDVLDATIAEAGCVCRVVVSDLRHAIGLCALGAEHARGQFVFFTESHCWPEPDVLLLCERAFDAHRDWAALSCRSLPVASNRLGKAEGRSYAADIEQGLTQHPWRKVLDQCFVTRRDAYTQSGGYKPEYGQFAEWELGANYHQLGLFIGYLPEACFHHQYAGELRALRAFTSDFVVGEIRYLAEGASEPGSGLIEMPYEWIMQGNFERPLARALLKRALQDAWRGTEPSRPQHLTTAKRWLTPAIFGDRMRRTNSSIGVLNGYVRLRFANLFQSSRKLNDAFTRYLAALIHRQRLLSIATLRNAKRRQEHQRSSNPEPCNILAPDHTGFYPVENYQGTTFRWSETAAIVRVELPAGQPMICIDCLPVLLLPTIKDLRFHLDGHEIPDDDIVIEPSRIVIKAPVAGARSSTLGWTCSRFEAPNDPRVLGLPVGRIDLLAVP